MTCISCCRRWRQIASWKKPCRWRNCGIVELKNSAKKSEEICSRVRMFEQKHTLAGVVSKWSNSYLRILLPTSICLVDFWILGVWKSKFRKSPGCHLVNHRQEADRIEAQPWLGTTGKLNTLDFLNEKNFKWHASWKLLWITHKLPLLGGCSSGNMYGRVERCDVIAFFRVVSCIMNPEHNQILWGL